jgi:hypothetical protein
LKNKAIVRELHVYGDLVPVGAEKRADTQHRGIGKSLVKMAEEVSMTHNQDGVAIISGVGVRGYYEKLGYTLKETYMVKHFNLPHTDEFDISIPYIGGLGAALIGIASFAYYTIPKEFIVDYFKNETMCN